MSETISVFSERSSLVQGIADTLQRVYGDATQTVLDQRAAAAIWEYLQSRGVSPLSTVTALVAAAGGEIAVPMRVLEDPPPRLTTQVDRMTDQVKFKVRPRTQP